MNINQLDIEKIAKAIEVDAEHDLPGLRESLAQAKRGEFAAVHTPEQIMARRGRPVGSVKADPRWLSSCVWTLMCWRRCGPRGVAGRPG